MEWIDKALVLGRGQFRESDVWLRLLTEKHGITTVFAFGGVRSRKRFFGCLDVLNILSLRVDSGRYGQFLRMTEATLLKGPRVLRTNNKCLGIAVNCFRFLDTIGVSSDESSEIFALSCLVLEMLENGSELPELLPLWFRLRVASDQGYAPDFSVCGKCGAMIGDDFGEAQWHIAEGSVLCPLCGRTKGDVCLKPGMVAALAAIQHDPPSMWRVEGLPFDERKELAELVDHFVEYHLGLKWDKGRFVRT